MPIQATDLAVQIAAVERAMEPADNGQIALSLSALIGAVNPPRDGKPTVVFDQWWERNEALYVAALADLPSDLLKAGCMGCLKTSPFMPKPADIRKHVAEDLAARCTAIARLKIARDCLLRQKKSEADAAPADKDMVGIEDVMAKVRAALGRGAPAQEQE